MMPWSSIRKAGDSVRTPANECAVEMAKVTTVAAADTAELARRAVAVEGAAHRRAQEDEERKSQCADDVRPRVGALNVAVRSEHAVGETRPVVAVVGGRRRRIVPQRAEARLPRALDAKLIVDGLGVAVGLVLLLGGHALQVALGDEARRVLLAAKARQVVRVVAVDDRVADAQRRKVASLSTRIGAAPSPSLVCPSRTLARRYAPSAVAL